ncbi:hypothetical protein CRM22_006310 [Opisthorchis felineus]|uniref:Uncharacterized protein n=1 Tax=Opisthorchis felineus TaxID=147828 RepID=A0A4S2LUA8_OPIFE|nr:hypothetical protein CRM22_006310 [Opisthorchis felineus]
MADERPELSRRLSKRDSRVIRDKEKVTKLGEKLRTLGERSTFHGIDVLLEASPGWPRRTVLIILIIMCFTCILNVSHLIASFVNMPVSTVINDEKANFTFPIVAICPDSPFSIERVRQDEELKNAYLSAADFWIARSGDSDTKWALPEGYWRQRVKRSFRGFFYTNRSRLSWTWNDILVSCEYDGRTCEIDEHAVEAPTAVMPIHEERHWESNYEYPGLVSRISNVGPSLPSGWPREMPDPLKMVGKTEPWPKGKVVILDHPSKYYCFQLRLKRSTIKEPGSARGLHLVLRRPYDASKTQPALLSVETRPPVLQSWDDRLFLRQPESNASRRDARQAVAADGFHILISRAAKNEEDGSFSTDDMYKTSSSRSAARFGVRYGQSVSVSLNQFVHKRLTSVYRPCKRRFPNENYLELSSYIISGGFARRYFELSYTKSNCVAYYRQKVMYSLCRCFSEDYMVPLRMSSELLKLGFCHSPSPGVEPGSDLFMRRIACHDTVASMTGNEILSLNFPKSWKVALVIKLTDEIQRYWLCGRYCEEVVSEADIIQRHEIPTDLPTSVTGFSNITKRSDLVAITIYANAARVRVISEGEQANIFNLIASIGGTFGLYLGLSGVTLFEIIEALALLLITTPALCRMNAHRIRMRKRGRIVSKLAVERLVDWKSPAAKKNVNAET